MTDTKGPSLPDPAVKSSGALAEAYLNMSGVSPVIKDIQAIVKAPLAAQLAGFNSFWGTNNRSSFATALGLSGAGAIPSDIVKVISTIVGIRPEISGVLAGLVTMPAMKHLYGVEAILADAEEAHAVLHGTNYEAQLEELLTEDDRQSIEGHFSFVDLSDPKAKALLSWYTGIVVGMLYLAFILRLDDVAAHYKEVLDAIGLASAKDVLVVTAKMTRKALDARFPEVKGSDQ